VVHSLKSDSCPLGICAETASLCRPESNKYGSVVAEMPFTNPVAPAGTGIESSFARFDIPKETS